LAPSSSLTGALSFRRRTLPPLVTGKRLTEAQIKAAMLAGAVAPGSQTVSPMPDPLRPAPLLGVWDLAVVAALVAAGEAARIARSAAAQIWGARQGRLAGAPGEWEGSEFDAGSVKTWTVVTREGYTSTAERRCSDGSVYQQAWDGSYLQSRTISARSISVLKTRAERKTVCSGAEGVSNVDLGFSWSNGPNGTGAAGAVILSQPEGSREYGGTFKTDMFWLEPVSVQADGVSYVPTPSTDPTPLPPWPDLEPEAQPMFVPLPPIGPPFAPPLIAPTETPGRPGEGLRSIPGFVPGAVPSTQPGTTNPPGTAPAPAVPPVPWPAPSVKRRPAIAPARVAVPVTAPGTTFLPDGTALVGNGPRPSPVSIARELGKLEQKGELSLSRAADSGGVVGDLTDLLQLLIELMGEPYDPGSFNLSSPCEKDSEGNPAEPRTVSWGAGTGRFNEVRSMLLAVMELLQHSKELRQPVCTGARAVGDPFTVIFEEIGGGGGGGTD
jgi:hypothetical protein